MEEALSFNFRSSNKDDNQSAPTDMYAEEEATVTRMGSGRMLVIWGIHG